MCWVYITPSATGLLQTTRLHIISVRIEDHQILLSKVYELYPDIEEDNHPPPPPQYSRIECQTTIDTTARIQYYRQI